MDRRSARGNGRVRCRVRSASHRAVGSLRRQQRSWQPAFDQRPVRLPPEPRAGPGHCRADPQSRDRQRDFQETRPEHLFAQCSHYCELVSQPEQMPRLLEIAIQTALSRRGVSVIALPGDVALREAVGRGSGPPFLQSSPTVRPSDTEIAALAEILNASKKVTILGGAGCAGAHAELIELARTRSGADRARDAGERVHRARQSVRCGHDGTDRIRVRLSGDDELRRAPDAWDRFSVPAVPAKGCENRSGRSSGEQLGRRARLHCGLVGDVQTTLRALTAAESE